jgi:hypothetical protein
MTRPLAEATEGRVGLVTWSGMIQLQTCTLYAHKVPVLQSHHVIPKSWWVKAGIPVNTPMRDLCPNCHTAVHAAIDGLLRELDTSALPRRAVMLAKAALTGAKGSGLTPAPTL